MKIEISQMTALLTVHTTSCIAFFIWAVAKRRELEALFERWLFRGCESLMAKTQKRVKGVQELNSLEASIHSLAGDLGVSFTICITEDVKDFAQAHKMEIFSDLSKLNAYISQRIEAAEADRLKLKKAKKAYTKALRTYDTTAHEAAVAGSITIIKELEQIYSGLTSPDIKSLIPDGKWTEFVDVVYSIIRELKRLSALAIRYSQDCCCADESEHESFTEEERAYRILGISTSASSEEIKNVYHALARIYHGDKKIVQDDSRMKEINWAYKLLRNVRQF